MSGMTIGKLAAAERVSVETVRFYQRRGLLAQPQRHGAGYREYSEEDWARLKFIRRARALGFTVGEIAELLGPAAAQSSLQIAAAAQAKVAAIDDQVRDLIRLRCRLRQLVRVCEHGDDAQCAALALPASSGATPGGRTVIMARVVTDDSFDEAVRRSPRPVIVEFWAQWCPPCRLVAPVLDEIAADYAGQVELVTVNVDENPLAASRYRIMAVPTVSVFAGGELVKQLTGARSKAAFLRELGEFLGVPAG